LWSLPEIEPEADIARHCKARFLASVHVGDALPAIEHSFTHFSLTIHPQRVAVRRWPLRAEAPGLLWLTRDDALAAALPAPIRKLLAAL
jgi:A/G-specific adenine glycosylase